MSTCPLILFEHSHRTTTMGLLSHSCYRPTVKHIYNYQRHQTTTKTTTTKKNEIDSSIVIYHCINNNNEDDDDSIECRDTISDSSRGSAINADHTDHADISTDVDSNIAHNHSTNKWSYCLKPGERNVVGKEGYIAEEQVRKPSLKRIDGVPRNITANIVLRFNDTVQVREYDVTIGDHPGCDTDYCPLTLDWTYRTKTAGIVFDTASAEQQQQQQQGTFVLTYGDRLDILEAHNVSDRIIINAQRQNYRFIRTMNSSKTTRSIKKAYEEQQGQGADNNNIEVSCSSDLSV